MSDESNLEKRIRKVHEQAFDIYMGHRNRHPDFTFDLKQQYYRERTFEGGWFFRQTENTIFTSPYRATGNKSREPFNKSRKPFINFVIETKESGNYKAWIQIFPLGELNEDFVDEIKNTFCGGKKKKSLDGPWEERLKDFLEKEVPEINKIAKKHGVLDELLYTEKRFKELLNRTNLEENEIRSERGIQPIGNTENKPNTDQPLNQILYGPPGTGKTYKTVRIAKSILGINDEKINSIAALKNHSPEQVDFVTFHQSFSYEDFVEGLKADSDGGKITYKVKDGVFKRICTKFPIEKLRKTFDNLLDDFSDDVQKHLDIEEKLFLVEEYYIASINRLSKGGVRSFKIGKSSANTSPGVSLKMIKKHYKRFMEGEIKKASDIPRESGNTNEEMGTAKYLFPLLGKIKEFQEKQKMHGITYDIDKHSVKRGENRVLIIDEINRGNISSIFGELITLLEESKRLGNEEAISVKLPYSGNYFEVPNNLYIIATMNTSDRSLVQVDTALRRRFVFKEVPPNLDPKLLKNVEGINLREMLWVMNDRIEYLYDREHVIGHAYFMGLESFEDLRNRFQNQILPLLEEYFFDDWEKISLVLNDGNNRFYEKKKIKKELFFKDINMQEKSLFHRRDINDLEAEDFKRIYEFRKNDEE